ncbi:hypothetical protein JCM16303_001526 [Sporobolomyces ruberrimus]
MNPHTSDSDFRLGRLRFIRLPPTIISLESKTDSTSFDLGVAITDDYGTDIDLFESINLRLELISTTQDQPLNGVALKLASDERSNPSTLTTSLDFTFTPSRGPFHSLSLKLVSRSPKAQLPKRVRFRLSVAPTSTDPCQLSSESSATKRVRELVGEEAQPVLETWNDNRYIFLSVESGEVELTRQPRTSRTTEKVQTALRRIHLPSSPSTSITIVERPGLNNSTGQRLWDCAIGLSAYLSLHPASLSARNPSLPSSVPPPLDDDSPPSNKRRKTSGRKRHCRIVELGAGCALASLAASCLSRDQEGDSSIVATDIEATVSTTLTENLEYNRVVTRPIDKSVLDWGELTHEQVKEVVGKSTDLTLVATDVLYNPESHQLLLDTLLSFLRTPSDRAVLEGVECRALIAYKRRTEGDDGFFELARRAGLKVQKVWAWSEVSVWVLT